MSKSYDNKRNQLTEGLNDTLEVSQRTDFCVGYFNLRGWKEIGAVEIIKLLTSIIKKTKSNINH